MATEEQTQHNASDLLYSGSTVRAGQKLTITNRLISSLQFGLSKSGSPTGDVTFTIRRVSDDGVIASKVWGDAGSLTVVNTLYEAIFDTPVMVNEEVRILAEFSGGDSSNYVLLSLKNSDVKANECYTRYASEWEDKSDYDTYYIYTYTKVSPLPMHFRQ